MVDRCCATDVVEFDVVEFVPHGKNVSKKCDDVALDRIGEIQYGAGVHAPRALACVWRSVPAKTSPKNIAESTTTPCTSDIVFSSCSSFRDANTIYLSMMRYPLWHNHFDVDDSAEWP